MNELSELEPKYTPAEITEIIRRSNDLLEVILLDMQKDEKECPKEMTIHIAGKINDKRYDLLFNYESDYTGMLNIVGWE